jgi:hypothetical protein
MRAGTCPITEGPIRAWTVKAIGRLELGDSPDGKGQNPIVEGADMMIGVWDWGRVKEHVRHGWRNAEVLASSESESPSKWHLKVRKANGEVAHLDVYKGAGITESVITYEAAALVGLPRGHAYLVQVKGVRTDSDFRAKGVDVIRRATVRRNDCEELPLGQRPDVLLGMEDSQRLLGYLRAGWCGDPAKREALRVYADDTTVGLRGAPEPNQLEAKACKPRGKEEEKWTYVQRIRTGPKRTDPELRVMFDNDVPSTLILHTAAAKAALAPRGKMIWVKSPDSGEMEESSCKYSVPLLDYQGNVHLLTARGVDYTIYAKERRVPSNATCVFAEMKGKASKAHQAAGMVDLIVGRNNSKWHPQKICDSWQAKDNLTLMKSEFPPRYIVRETTSTKRKA